MRIWLGMVLTLAAACGNDNTQPDAMPEPELQDSLAGVHSGTRLKLRWNEVDGARTLATIFDSARNETCSSVLWADGNRYCTPLALPMNAFKDASCTMPIVREDFPSACRPTPIYLSQSTPAAACGGGSTRARMYKAVPVTLTEHYTLTSLGCSRSISSIAAFYEPGEEVPSADLVKMTRGTPEGSGRLRFVYDDAADGARTFAFTQDTQLEGYCLMIPKSDYQSQQCITSSVSSYEYADATCTSSPRASYRSDCPVPKYAATTPTCSQDIVMRTIGAPASSSPLYEDTGTRCEETTATPSKTYYELGAVVSMATLPRHTPAAPRRIEPVRYADGTVGLHGEGFYDQQYRTDCFPSKLADGSVRCLPATHHLPSTTSYFNDASCQSPIAVLELYEPSCSGPPPAAVTVHTAAGCQFTHEVRAVGAAYSGAIYRFDGTSCISASSPSQAFYLLGATIPLTGFPVATLVTEP